MGQRLQNGYLLSFIKKVTLIQTKRIAMILLIAIATVGAIGIATEMGMQSAHACFRGTDCDDTGHGQSFHDSNGDLHSNGHA